MPTFYVSSSVALKDTLTAKEWRFVLKTTSETIVRELHP